MRCDRPGRAAILWSVRNAADRRLPGVRGLEPAGPPLLRHVRRRPHDREVLEAAVTRVKALPVGYSSPMLEAEVALGRAQLAAHGEAVAAYIHAVTLQRGLDTPFGLAQALLGHGEALLGRGDLAGAEPLLEEARELFAELGARSWVERASGSCPAAVA